MITHSSDSLTGNILCASSELAGGYRGKQDTDSPLPRGGVRVVRGQAFKETQAGKGLWVGPTCWGQSPGAQWSPKQVPPDMSLRLAPAEGLITLQTGQGTTRGLVSHLPAPSFFFPFTKRKFIWS